ncbi:MAG: hypothetical protein ACTSVY_13400 [Candidatus Helarchaeota archaeon]
MALIYEEDIEQEIKGTIIDFETIGSFRKFLDYRAYLDIYPIVFGTLFTKKLRIHYVIDADDIPELLIIMNQEINTLPRPFWAFNMKCEQGIIYNRLGITVTFWELNKWQFESKRDAAKKLKITNFNDPFQGYGAACAKAFRKGNIEDILKHNRACLLTEAEIWKHRFNDITFKFMEIMSDA